jgi:hypothetical protein
MSVVVLAKKAVTNSVNVAKSARETKLRKMDNVNTAKLIAIIEAKGKPIRCDMTEARVCSSQVMGNQYGTWTDNLIPPC